MISYTASILRYVHDVVAGESLNIGVVLLLQEPPFVLHMVDPKYERLSTAFSGFDGDLYRSTINHFQSSADRLAAQWQGAFAEMTQLPEDARSFVEMIWPDRSLSFQASPAIVGLTSDPTKTVPELFDRFVTSQYFRERRHNRDDDEVWRASYYPHIASVIKTSILKPKHIVTSELELDLKCTFKNERLHAIEPVSFDYVNAESMQTKASKWLGYGVALSGHEDLGHLYLLLGKPRDHTHIDAYEKAKKLLDRIPIEHELIEEDGAEDFARRLGAYVAAHDIKPDTE